MRDCVLPTHFAFNHHRVSTGKMSAELSAHEQSVQRSSDFVRAIFGWRRSPVAVVEAATMFRGGWLHDSRERRQTRDLAMSIVQDTVSHSCYRMSAAALTHLRQVEVLDELCAVGSVTFHIHGERRPGSGAPTVDNIAPNISSTTSTNLLGYSGTIRMMQTIFARDIAVSFAGAWHENAVENGYLARDTLPVPASPLRVAGAARVFSPPPSTTSRGAFSVPSATQSLPVLASPHRVPAAPSRVMLQVPSATHSTPTTPTRQKQSLSSRQVAKGNSNLFKPPSAKPASTTTSLSTTSSLSSSSISSSAPTVIAGPNVSYDRNIFQSQTTLPREALDFLEDLGLGGVENNAFVAHVYLNAVLHKWFAMLKNRFTNVEDDLLLLLIQKMKQ